MNETQETRQEIARAISEEKILLALKKGKIRWSKLKKTTGIKSSRTLSDRVHSLIEDGLIRRIVNNKKQPPAVYYERTSKTSVLELPEGPFHELLNMTIEDKQDQKAIIAQKIETQDPETAAEDSVQYLVEQCVVEFLFTLKHIIENPKHAPYFIYMSAEAYSATLEALAPYIRQLPHLADAVKRLQTQFMEDRKKEREGFLDETSSRFKDKPLVKAIFIFFGVQFSLGKTKSKLYDFAKEIEHNPELKSKLEKEFGSEISEERLQVVLKDKAWSTLKSQDTEKKRN